MYVLERFLAIFLGIVVLPLRAFAYHAFYVIIALLVGVFASVGLPLSFALTLNHEGISKAINLFLTLFLFFQLLQ